MKTNFSLLFYLKKPKNYVSGDVPVYMRITVDGVRSETSAGRECDPDQWNSYAGRLKGTKEDVKTFNAYLDDLQSKVYEAHKILSAFDVPITAETLKNKLLGKTEKPKMLIGIFEEHNQQVKALIDKEFAKGTHKRYETSLRHTQDFLKWKYHLNDINIKKINHEFVTSYDFYLRTVRKCNNNSTIKYIKNFKKVVRICMANGWLDKDPFVKYKAKIKVVDRVFLSHDELATMAKKVFDLERLNQVRDIFLFSCFTGLAYADVQKLKQSEIVKGIDGEMWIYTKRQKTTTPTRVPLLPPALALLSKYKDHPICSNCDKAFPVSTNQKMNAYLKEIAGLCGIKKDLTYHIARHTFATTVTLSNGVPIETVSKMLGHTNIKTTQHYAKILDMKVSQDMALLKNKYETI